MFYKRLERGRYALTTHNGSSKQLKREELLMLLEGLSFQSMGRKNGILTVDIPDIKTHKTFVLQGFYGYIRAWQTSKKQGSFQPNL